MELFLVGANKNKNVGTIYHFSFSSSELYYAVQFPINPYGKAKKMAEDIILDFSKSKRSDMAVMILRLDYSPRYQKYPLLKPSLIADLY